ncbi:hypothetical protein Bpfe_031055 [Biomphalaria pfeifferi]|uniref:Uncharacterized protein n=1 Tax=Biomphalaria pfeifferi TaxID=112525 RepID=A0AAD8EU55_BIOPF|nr:hypothetical protein Bpfe_031055 [Biomphalaria pfeifferi]
MGILLRSANESPVDEDVTVNDCDRVSRDADDSLEEGLVLEFGEVSIAGGAVERVHDEVATCVRARTILGKRDEVREAGGPVEDDRQNRCVIEEHAHRCKHPDRSQADE